MKLLVRLWGDDAGVVAAEYLLVGSVVVLGLVLGLANLEACPELHAALRCGAVRAYALVYDPATSEVEQFEGAGFRPMSASELACLIGGRDARPSERILEAADAAFSMARAPRAQETHALGGSA